MKETKLTKYAEGCFRLNADLTPAERAKVTARCVGKHAKRLNYTTQELTRWLQSAYGRVWVKLGNLNPGADLKEIQEILLMELTRT